MQSIRSFSRARTSEKGFALIAALTLAVLYFGLMELLLVDSSRELSEARRFRARVVAGAVVENAAELAAVQMVSGSGRNVQDTDEQGTMNASFRKTGGDGFEIVAEAVTSGVIRQSARLFVQGRVEGNGVIRIDYTMHGQ